MDFFPRINNVMLLNWLKLSPFNGKRVMLENKTLEKVMKGDLYALLSICSKDELNTIVSTITDPVSGFLDQEESYKKYFPDHTKYYSLIGDEIRLFGGDSFANIARGGEGISYDEIVIDVCNRLKIPCENENTAKNEENLLSLYLLEQDKVKSNTTKVKTEILKMVLMRVGLGPIGWLSVPFQLAGPAFRVTVPCVLHIALLRQKKIKEIEVVLSSTGLDISKESSSNINLFKQENVLNINNHKNEPVLSLAQIPVPLSSIKWQSIDSNDKGISRISPLFQSVPSLITAHNVNTTKYMEVVINGPLVIAKGGGYRGWSIGSNGKISEQATLFDPSKLSKIVNASALFQIASVAVAQKHLADISEKLSEIKSSIERIESFQQNQRKSVILGSIQYFEQVAPSVIKGELSGAILNQIEAKESELLNIQIHLIEDIDNLNLNIKINDTDTFGTESIAKGIQLHQDKVHHYHNLLLLCIRARACGWQLLSVYPENVDLIKNRRDNINSEIQKLDENGVFLKKSNDVIQKEIRRMSSTFNTDATLNERKLKLLNNSQSIFANITLERKKIEQELQSAKNLAWNLKNPVASMIVKIENDQVVAINTA